MDTIQLLGYEKREVLYEGERALIYRAQSKEGKSVLIKALKEEQPTIEQLTRLELEYTLLGEEKMTGMARECELIRHYKGHILLVEDVGGIPLVEAPIFAGIQQGDRTLTKEMLQWIFSVFLEMVEAVRRIHDQRFIHKDINPANFLILLDSNQVIMLDFGQAIKVDYLGSELNPVRVMDGAIPYISPEQTGRTGRAVDYRTDFYSLGATMYELLTGQRPFTTEDPLELVHCHIAELPVLPHELNQSIPPMVSAILMKLMAKAPEQRYQSETGIVHDLRQSLEQLQAAGSIVTFELGASDVSTKFQIPQKLYGREKEKEALKKKFIQAAEGSAQLILIGGYSGVGKTSLVQEICRPLAEAGGFFASGKAEQFQKNSPYYIFAKAAKELVVALLQESDTVLEEWKESLLKALKGNGRLIVDLVPELGAVIGPQQPVNELGPAENRNRFQNTYGNFISVFAQKKHPLTLSLDDLQWCDRSSMELIKYLLVREDLENLTMIGCYRNNELQEGHPLCLLLDELLDLEKVILFPIGPLEEPDIAEMLAEMLGHEINQVRELAGLIYKKSQGNPFFVKKLLSHLYEGQFIRFNGTQCMWEWDTRELEGIAISDNIVDILIRQLLKLPPVTQELLKLAALVGGTFDLRTLSLTAKLPLKEIATDLEEAIHCEIILPSDNDFIIVRTLETENLNASFQFVHDRVQQACVELMTVEQQKELQLKIGRVLYQNTPKAQWRDRAMDIVGHLNEAIEWIETKDERMETAKLNWWACQKAKASSAYYLALRYIENSVRLLPETIWVQDYQFAFEVSKTYVECAYLNNEYGLAEEQARLLLDRAKTPMEQAEIRLMQSKLFNYLGQLSNAIEYAILGLQLLNVHVVSKPGMPLLLKEMIVVKAGLAGKKKEDLLNMPPMKNEKIKRSLKLWNEINRAASLFGNINLFLLSILKQMQMTLRYGNSHEAGLTYVSYAMILAILGDYKGTYEFCDLALLFHEKEQSLEYRPTTLFSSGFFGHTWNRSWCDLEKWFEQAMEEAIRYGDHHTIALAGTFMYAHKSDATLPFLMEKSMEQFLLVKRTNNWLYIHLAFLTIHRWLNYAGLTDGLFSMSVSATTYEKNGGIGIVYSEEECLEELRKGNFLSAFGVYYKEKMYIHYLYDDYAKALEYLKEADQYLNQHVGTPFIVECRVCSFLVLSANIMDMTKEEARKAHSRMKQEYRQVKTWAKHCPVNFVHLQYMMEAELERLAKRVYVAAELYDKAILMARQNGFIRDEALANELAAKMFLAQGKVSQAAFYFSEARKIYRLWGAVVKVSQMDEKYGYLIKTEESDKQKTEKVETVDALDQMSVEKASQAVLNETHIPKILFQILRTVIENSGAQKAVLLLKSEQGWKIIAQALPGRAESELPQSIPLEQGEEIVPVSVIHYCIRTREYIVLGDAAGASRFQKDPYIKSNQIKSLLCMSVLNQGSEEGILYLENNLVAGVFTKEREQILQALAAQFSISINNIRLFMDLLEKNEEVHKATEEVLRSDIAFLQAQIKPHFLYNAINTISAFSLDDSQMTRDLLAKLSEYLRGSFDFKNRDRLVTLSKELELVEAYLFIEKARFGDRLKIIYLIEEGADCLLPPLVIQPLVENAVQHGLSNRKRGGTVEIHAHREEDHIFITVEDDGAGMDDDTYEKLFEENTGKRSGVALKNIQRRLTQMYGQGLTIERKATGGTKVTIRITK